MDWNSPIIGPPLDAWTIFRGVVAFAAGFVFRDRLFVMWSMVGKILGRLDHRE